MLNTLRKAREQRDLTQKKLAGISGVDSTVISRIESGVIARPAWETVARLSRALRVPPEKLFPVSIKTA
jgi:transcriptional regulator with XRE-family HTH domain